MTVYGASETIKNGIAFIYTKIFWKKARLIRLPIWARNKKNIHYMSGLTTGYGCRLNAGKHGEIKIGKNCVMGDFVQIEGQKKVEIGDNVLFASRIFVSDTSHGDYSGIVQSLPHIPPNERECCYQSVKIEENVWIGNGVSILPGVTVGKGTVIGANSVVTKDIPRNSIVAGVPARVIKQYNDKTEKWEKICNI